MKLVSINELGEQVETSRTRRTISLPVGFPQIITLCGSTRFAQEYKDVLARLTLQGHIVISVGLLGHQEGLDMASQTKKDLDELHLRKIDLADLVFIINAKRAFCPKCPARFDVTTYYDWKKPGIGAFHCHRCNGDVEYRPYIGESTRREIAYAQKQSKPITYLEPI